MILLYDIVLQKWKTEYVIMIDCLTNDPKNHILTYVFIPGSQEVVILLILENSCIAPLIYDLVIVQLYH